jgi:two-component system LytT family response regulator
VKHVSALIVDDEPLARRRLRELVSGVAWLECVGEAEDGLVALEAIERLRPDLVFLDVEMPRMSGLELVERLQHRPELIFTTAFDRYAVTAFELHALDYLLKPFGRERFLQAVERAREALGEKDQAAAAVRLRQALGPAGPLRRIFVRSRGRVLAIAVHEVERLEAQDDYVAVHVRGHQHLVHAPLADVEGRLEPGRFLRIHRSHIVNLDHVAAFVEGDDGRFEVEMRDGRRLTASRARSRAIRQRSSGRPDEG